MSDAEFDVLVVGAGFGGLSTAAALRRYGVPRVGLLEGGETYGAFWKTNYDRISLHTAWHGLPDDGGDGERYAMFKPRRELLEYFARYAERHQLAELTRFEAMVSEIERDRAEPPHPWDVRTSAGDYRARFVVVCTGYCRRPSIPQIANQDRYAGELLHSKAYRNGEPFRGSRMLVVGSGNSAAEIATELAETGAASVAMLVHGPRYYIPIDRFADLLVQARDAGAAGPEGINNLHPFTPGTEAFEAQLAEFDAMLRPLTEDLSAFGIEQPTDGPFTEFNKRHRVLVIDQGANTVDAKRRHRGHQGPDRRIHPQGVQLAETGKREFDGIILATGGLNAQPIFNRRNNDHE